ncbi:hypothetical protein [Gilliamella sp. WF3-4]|jgi:hypothetical protein|uniref:hypothetical protein n=1 Tax=Gilliamella sp. WF3-4 TaxID=3120255 RepID=UPI00159EDCB6|nr:hypothetical protein [Gilliamella apicola]
MTKHSIRKIKKEIVNSLEAKKAYKDADKAWKLRKILIGLVNMQTIFSYLGAYKV